MRCIYLFPLRNLGSSSLLFVAGRGGKAGIVVVVLLLVVRSSTQHFVSSLKNAWMPSFGRHRHRQREAPAVTASSVDDFARQATHLIPAEIRMISGCHSEQTSADVQNVLRTSNLPNPAGKAGGACTSALLETLYTKGGASNAKALTLQQILLDVRDRLASQGFDQIPQLTSSRPLQVEATPFDLGGHAGTKRAILIGINYRGQDGQLHGCHNDVYNMQQYLVNCQGFPECNILMLLDKTGQQHLPTKRTILLALRQVVTESIAGDSVFLLYSGHGGLLYPETNWFKQRRKDYDETLYPLDHQDSGLINDLNLYKNFVQPMTAGVTVTALMDCCHSGSVLDLPYAFQPTSAGTIRARRSMDSLANMAMLYVLLGGVLPSNGFENVSDHFEDVTGGNLDDYQGVGLEEVAVSDEAGGGCGDAGAAVGEAYNEGASDGQERGFGDGGPVTGEPIEYCDDPDMMQYPSEIGDAVDWDAGGGMDGDADCSCLGDVLTALLEQDD